MSTFHLYDKYVRDFDVTKLVSLVAHTQVEGYRTAEFLSFRVKLPARLDGELRTHRQIAKNAASFRAIPTERFIQGVIDDPFIPWAWTANEAGMQGPLITDPYLIDQLIASRLQSRYDAIAGARREQAKGVHKQEANRVLQPYSWLPYFITIRKQHLPRLEKLRTGTMAERHFFDIAKEIVRLSNESQPKRLKYHLPYLNQLERRSGTFEEMAYVSAARIARISLNRDDKWNPFNIELEKGRALASADPVHATPFEHQICMGDKRSIAKQGCFVVYNNKPGGDGEPIPDRVVQFRKLIPNE